MASSSTSSIHKRITYDVFLSFRGTDTRKNFVDHLYHALQDKSIHTYKDDEEIKKGKKISDELIRSIQDSRFYIIVFSKDYASSSWCLDELVKIMECHKTNEHIAYPVFYDVEPTEVRHQSRAVGKAFAQHEKKEASEKWRQVLKEAADLAGWELKNTADGHEAKFIQKIVEVISLKLSGLTVLQKKVLSGVFNNQNINLDSVSHGKNMMKRMMCGRKVLVVLDDVDHIEQLEALAGELNWFKPGSIIIITTRYEQVLRAHGVELIHNINLLSNKEAICLFNKYAFVRKIPVQGYEKLSEQVVRCSAGLPLTIKVLGSFLCGKDESEWIDAIDRLKTIPLKETLKRLELSYIDLDDDYKEIFLDLACMMKGWPKNDAIKALESCGYHAKNGLRVLEHKSLITFRKYYLNGEYGEHLGMHAHIEEMGRDIVRRSHPNQPYKHSRLWNEEEIEYILTNDLGTEATICMQICASKLNPEIVMKGLRKMKELRSLPQSFQANDLVALMMAHSKIVQLWEGGERKVCNKLRFLDLSNSMLRTLDLELTPKLEMLTLERCCALTELPDSICMLKHLKSLKLDRCSLLEKLPEHLGRLQCLEKLSLSSTCITHLPESICMLKQLRYLKLGECSLLEKLPEDVGRLESLEHLELSLTKIKHLPSSICTLKHLKYLGLHRCLLLEKLPEGLGGLECLKMIILTSTKIIYLPDSICMLKHLEALPLNDCSLLERLPVDLDKLECLEMLNLSSTKIKRLPDSICTLKHLKSLVLYRCSLLEKLPEDLGSQLGCLKSLDLSYTKIKHLPDSICLLKDMKYLKLDKCLLLEKLPEDIGRLGCLQYLNLSSTRIKHLPDSSCMLKDLKHLKLNNCSLLEKLPEDLGSQLGCLESLELSSTKIKHLPNSVCMLKDLKYLKLDKCSLLELPEDLGGQLGCLENLDLSSTKIKYLPDSICLLKDLKYLKLDKCRLLEKLPDDLGWLGCLESLTLSSTKIKHLPNSSCMLNDLKCLKLDKCLLLEKLPEDLGRLGCLEYLKLSSTKIKCLPDSSCMLKDLQHLKLDKCSLLEKLPEDLGEGLGCLESLDLSSTKIKHLPDSICMLKDLKYLKLDKCSLLEKLPEDIGRLGCLDSLDLSSTKIKHLPDSICMMKDLASLKLNKCSLLEKLPEDLGQLGCLKKLFIDGTCISHLPQSILLHKGLHIYGSRGRLQSFGFTSDIKISEDGMVCYVKV